eukprot:gene3732-2629_t
MVDTSTAQVHDDFSEMLAGSLGGAAATAIEYPMDTVKVRLQDDGKRYKSILHCIKHIREKEGILNGFFRGLPAPVLGAAFENAILFVSYRGFINALQALLRTPAYPQDAEPLAMVAAAGAAGGVVVSVVLTPAELVKCRMQVHNTLPVSDRVYRNSLQCLVAMHKKRGVRGLFRGHVAMTLREAIGCGWYFITFQYVIRAFLSEGQSFHEVTPLVHLLGGGCAGVAFWTTTYPIDAVKTKQQTMKADYVRLNFRQSCRRLYRTEGLRGLFRGYSVTALRAFPGNAVLIAVYEQVNKIYSYTITQRRRTTTMHSPLPTA